MPTLFISLFLFLLPTQLGKHFFLDFSYINGVRVDYNTMVLYTTDILVLILAVLYRKQILSSLQKNAKRWLILTLLFSANVLLSQFPQLALYQGFKLFEVYLVFLIFNNARLSNKILLGSLAVGALLQLTLALAQFQLARSLQGVFYYFGERLLSLSTPGVAKASIAGREILRPYGTFSHPNSMGGFYALVYAFTLFTGLPSIKHVRFEIVRIIKPALLLISSMLVLLSFSKVAIITYIIITALYVYLQKDNTKCTLCKAAKIIVPATISLVFLQAMGDPFSLAIRGELLLQSLGIVWQNLFFGTGLGHYLFYQAGLPSQFARFALQPVHNIYLLFLAQSGVILGGAVTYVVYKYLWMMRKNRRFIAIILVILITGSLDHYWLTLQQNMLLLGVVFGITSSLQSQ